MKSFLLVALLLRYAAALYAPARECELPMPPQAMNYFTSSGEQSPMNDVETTGFLAGPQTIDIVEDSGIYYAVAKIGTAPAPDVKMLIDTGSTDLIAKRAAQPGDGYSPTSSPSSQNLHTTFDAGFAGGGYTEGDIFTDTVKFGNGDPVVTQAIGAAVIYEGMVSTLRGVIGLGRIANTAFIKIVDKSQVLPIVVRMKTQAVIPNYQFGISLSRNKLYIGDKNLAFVENKPKYMLEVSRNDIIHWMFTFTALEANGVRYAAAVDIAIDSGLAFLTGPSALVETVYASLFKFKYTKTQKPNGVISYTYKCSDFKSFKVSFGDARQPLTVDMTPYFNIQQRGDQCDGALAGFDDPKAKNLWIAGVPFLKGANVGFVYDDTDGGYHPASVEVQPI